MTKALYFLFGAAVGVGIGSVGTYMALRSRYAFELNVSYDEEEKSLKTENTALQDYSERAEKAVFIKKDGVKPREDDVRTEYEEKTKIYRSLEDDERLKREMDRQIKEENEVGKVIFKSNEVISESMYDELVKNEGYNWEVIEAISDGNGKIIRYQYENGTEIDNHIIRGIEEDVEREVLDADYDVGAFLVDHSIKMCYQVVRVDPDLDEEINDPDDDLAEIPDELDGIEDILPEEGGNIPGYRTVALWYYIPDQLVVTDEDNAEMDDFEEHIGNNAISNFQDGTIKWIRNREEHIDYVLTFTSEHYDSRKLGSLG